MDDLQSAKSGSDLPPQTDEVESDDAAEVHEALSVKIAGFLRVCWVRRKMIFGILAAGFLLSLLYALSLPNVYTSTTTLMPPDNSSPYSGVMSLLAPSSSAASLGSGALELSTPGDLFISILESRNVQDGLINRFDLNQYYKTRFVEDTRGSLAGATKISQDRDSGIITISVSTTNPVLASNIVRGYVMELDRVVTENSTSAARRERIFLEERVKDVKQQLDQSAKELSQFSTKSGAIDMPSQTRSMVDEGLRLQAELIDGRSQLAALQQVYSESNSKVRALEAHNAELQRELDKMGGVSQGKSANADTNKSPYPSAEELPSLGLTYYDLERKVRIQEELWEALTKQYEAAKVQEAEEIPTVRVLDVADVPQRKSGPPRRLILEMGTLLSGLLACIVVLFGIIWEAMDAQDEPRKLITEAADALLDPRRTIWKLPGFRWLHGRIKKPKEPR